MVGVTRACATALGFRSLLNDLGLQKLSSRVWTDSSAAIGICKRQGLGKIRHLDTQMFWVQRRVRNNDLDLYYVAGEKNPADIFTKPNIPQARMDCLLKSMGCEFREGRPACAPELRKEGGTNVFTVRQTHHGIGQRSSGPDPAFSAPRVRWCDINLEGEPTFEEDVKFRGLPHQRCSRDILSMHLR